MYIKTGAHWLRRSRRFSTVRSLMSSSFNIYTNNCLVSSNQFFSEVFLMNKKLTYYVKDYFGLPAWSNTRGKRVGCLFPPCYSQLVFQFCVLMNNYDYVSIPTPVKKSKHIKQKYSFYIAENNIDLILCHPFYKHFIEEITLNLQIPFLICYDRPDVLSHEEYLDDLKEGREIFGHKFMYQPKEDGNWTNGQLGEELKEEQERYFIGGVGTNSSVSKEIIPREGDSPSAFHMYLCKENECDKSVQFLSTCIFNQSMHLSKFINWGKDNTIALLCVPANNIAYFDVLFSLLFSGAAVTFPEASKKKTLNYNSYMDWFKEHMKSKENNFAVHNLLIKKDFTDIDFDFIDGKNLFEELFHVKTPINILICNNYLIRDFLSFFKNSDMDVGTKMEFIQKKASHVRIILLNGNEIMPGINVNYLEQIKDVFINARIYLRYVVQEVGTVSIMELGQLEQDNIPYERKLAGYVLPSVHVKIDPETNLMKIKSDNVFSQYYNNGRLTNQAFDQGGFFKTKYVASLAENALLKIEGIHNDVQNLPDEYYLYFKQRRDKMEKHPPGYLKRVRLQGQIWGNFHANRRNWKRKF
ncbi:Uncharacterized protein PCOAH_00022570 [Plasmodium coatneyi]|uniref:AMP-dependent synthetase/ligase domain-containing protein n=1 Tax=Plasmodium coatneyi TaxID=208452 RepID=A0A1B1DYV8_9APIC|nr:Uncharacterized protein PCOAH_00022570 [Plasmodium coatneyi]ANQ07799.1 Uncharacterized protein PCOAH_00022570 [Plasmodium coatneyi]